MAVDLNVDLGELIQNLIKKSKDGGGGAGNAGPAADIIAKILPLKSAIILFVLSALIFGLYIKYYYMPMVKSNEKKAAEIARLQDLKQKTQLLELKIVKLKKNLSDSKERYLESLSHFGNSEDLGELYQSVSTLAVKYDLVVLNIKELPRKIEPKVEPKKGEKAPPPKSKTEVKEVQVEIELKGRYSQYVKFKEDLSVAEMLLKVNSENIKVKGDKEDQGKIFVKLNLSTYAIDKNQFNEVMKEDKDKKNAK